MKFNVNVDKRLGIPHKILHENSALPVYVSFVGSFNEDSARKFREEFISSENAAKDAGQEVLPLVIDSYGGSVHSLFSMIDVVKNCDLKVATIVEGKAMSCGAFLFSCGTEGYRFVSPRAVVMIHGVSAHAGGKVEDIKADVKEFDRQDEMAFDLLDENCGKSKGFFKEELAKRKWADWYLPSEDCVKYNLANYVGQPSLDIDIKLEHKFNFNKK